jgi:hypothetical protein
MVVVEGEGDPNTGLGDPGAALNKKTAIKAGARTGSGRIHPQRQELVFAFIG